MLPYLKHESAALSEGTKATDFAFFKKIRSASSQIPSTSAARRARCRGMWRRISQQWIGNQWIRQSCSNVQGKLVDWRLPTVVPKNSETLTYIATWCSSFSISHPAQASFLHPAEPSCDWTHDWIADFPRFQNGKALPDTRNGDSLGRLSRMIWCPLMNGSKLQSQPPNTSHIYIYSYIHRYTTLHCITLHYITCIHAYMHAYMHPSIHYITSHHITSHNITYIYVCIHAYIYIYIHHPYTHTCVYI